LSSRISYSPPHGQLGPRLVSAAEHCDDIDKSQISHLELSMKIYTKKGDSGLTGLYGGRRVSKAHLRIEAFGTVDELNSALGVARSAQLGKDVDAVIEQIQHQLFELGSQLATPTESEHQQARLTAESIAMIERSIDRFDDALPQLTQFILPAGCPGATALHLARTICRRAERGVVRLSDVPDEHVAKDAIVYLNRIGDLLFVLARFVNHAAGQADEPWVPPTA
jgi:cob(I)alamin adenosyltransferase